MTINTYVLDNAAKQLSDFIKRRALILARHIGISYTVEEDASKVPSDYQGVRHTFRQCVHEGKPFPVWAGGSESVIYTDAETNHAFRFWHDWTHYAYGLDMSTEDEAATASIQADNVAAAFGRGSLEYQLFLADTLGQTTYHALTDGKFPDDQKAFVYGLVNLVNRCPAASNAE